MSQKILGKNQLACLKALSQLPANQAPVQIREKMQSNGVYLAKTNVGALLREFVKRGYAKREGIPQAYDYTITETGKNTLKRALAGKGAIAPIKNQRELNSAIWAVREEVWLSSHEAQKQ